MINFVLNFPAGLGAIGLFFGWFAVAFAITVVAVVIDKWYHREPQESRIESTIIDALEAVEVLPKRD